MKTRINYGSFIMVGAAALAAALVLADESDLKSEEMVKKMEAAGRVGAEHKALEPLVGNWTAEVKTWMVPGSAPAVTKATAKSAWIMDGRFVQEEFNGEFMGKPFRGMSLTGYDNTEKKYKSMWIDDMHTSMMTSEGQGENGNKVITLAGQYDCPLTGEKDLTMKQVIRIESRDKHVLEMYDPSKGENSKTMEITYTRK